MQKVAVKKISALSTQSQADFESEAQLLMKLRPHENVISFIGLTLNPISIITAYQPNGILSPLFFLNFFSFQINEIIFLKRECFSLYQIR